MPQPRPHLSLKRQLLLWLLLPQLVLWLVGGALAYRMALNYAQKGIDQSLTQSVRSLSRQVKPVGSGLLIDFPRAAQDIIEQDPQDRVTYMVSSPPGSFVLGNATLPAPPAALLQNARTSPEDPLLYDIEAEGKPMRVALIEVNYGDAGAPQRLRVQLAKSLAVQERIARELVADMLAPLVALGAVLGLLMFAGITRGLRPLKRLATQLGERSDANVATLTPIEMTQAPQEVHALVHAVNQLLAAVRRSLSQEKRFINDAAHQLRTPLAGLISQTELAVQEAQTGDLAGVQARLAKVLRGAQRSAHLMHQLLALARTETEVELKPLNVAALAREVAREWTPRAVQAGIDLGFEGPDALPVRGEKLLLREALTNLLDNALRYAGGQPDTVVTLRASQTDTMALLEVADNGPGLTAAELPHLFERFWRASEQPGGCGLGLSIVEEIVKRHGGMLSAEAVLPHGLCVQIRLPLAP